MLGLIAPWDRAGQAAARHPFSCSTSDGKGRRVFPTALRSIPARCARGRLPIPRPPYDKMSLRREPRRGVGCTRLIGVGLPTRHIIAVSALITY